jgi:hypothetical protein
MYSLKELLERGSPYDSTGGTAVALTAGDVPDPPGNWTNSGPFISYQRSVFNLARSVIMWWTPARVEHEALRMAGDVEGPSVLSEEAYTFRTIFMQTALLVAEWVHAAQGLIVYQTTGPAEAQEAATVSRQAEMMRDLLQEAVTALERKAQQMEARAMDLRMRYDAQNLRAMLAGLDVSTKLSTLMEAAQRGTEAQEHLNVLAVQLREPLLRAERALGSIALVADWQWDRVLDKDAEAKKLSTTMQRIGKSLADATVQAFLGALAQKYMLRPHGQ